MYRCPVGDADDVVDCDSQWNNSATSALLRQALLVAVIVVIHPIDGERHQTHGPVVATTSG